LATIRNDANKLNSTLNLFTKIYRIFWLILLFLLIFFDRENFYWTLFTLVLLLILSGIAILRALESRQIWRNYIKEEGLDTEKNR